MVKRRRIRTETKLPATIRSLYIIMLSIISILIFVGVFAFAVTSEGNTIPLLAAAGTISMLVSLICVLFGYREFKDKSRHILSRISALFIPLISLVLWMSLYAVGYIYN